MRSKNPKGDGHFAHTKKMIKGQDLNTLAQQILEQAKQKRDYAMDTRKLSMTDDGQLLFAVNGQFREVRPTERCLNQIGNRIKIPRAYLHRMRDEAPALLARNVNHWFQNKPELRMLRTWENGNHIGRAFLSNRFRPLDNEDMMRAILPHLSKAGCEVVSAQVTERRLYIQAVTPKIQGEVKVGDVVQAGVTISNSEVGCGNVKVEPLVYRLACLNGMIMNTAMRRHHVGRAGEGEWAEGEASELFTDETRKLDDKAFWAKVRDVVTASLTDVKLQEEIARMKRSTKIETGKPNDAVEIVQNKFDLSEGESDSVLEHLAKGGDLSLWGLANAVTRTAEDADDYDRAIELQRIGSDVIELPQKAFAI